MKTQKYLYALITLLMCFLPASAISAPPPVQTPSSEAEIGAALTGGVPGGRWKEGLLFEGVKPMPWGGAGGGGPG
jgi:ribonuclease Z